MKKVISIFALLLPALLAACAYRSPPREEWPMLLHGASNEPLTPMLHVATRPLFQAAGGNIMPLDQVGGYMNRLEDRLTNEMRKPGIQFSRFGNDILIVMVRASFMYTDTPDISRTGDDLLRILARILNDFDMTWIEIIGYTDAMYNQAHAIALSQDMAHRVGVYLSRRGVKPVRMFLSGRGSSNPIADQSDVGRLTNLRVEIRLSPVVR